MIIQVDDFEVVVKRKEIKNINLRIHSSGHIHLSAPHSYSIKDIQRFLQEKKNWIKKHSDRLQIKPQIAEPLYQTGEQHYFLGKAYTLKVHVDSQKNTAILGDKYLYLYVPNAASTTLKSKILYAWYHEQMHALLPHLLHKWQVIIGVQLEAYRIKMMKSLWGSCRPAEKKICLNLHLIKKPYVCIEYVLVHELVHMLEASHNQRFYQFMNQFMPQWKEYKALLT